MARLEYINFVRWREAPAPEYWIPDQECEEIKLLPQIFWKDGQPWSEVNHWALEKSRAVDPETTKSLLKHLHAYAKYLEQESLDWRHFPIVIANRAIVKYRGVLRERIDKGELASSTGRSRMSAVMQFYKHAQVYGLVNAHGPLWDEKAVKVPFYDAVGFSRVMTRQKAGLAISNTARVGQTLEDGLLPLREEHMLELLNFAKERVTTEFRLMLRLGFFTGARIGTITTLRVHSPETACPHPVFDKFCWLPVGPGTGIATKFSITGNLWMPDVLLRELEDYAGSSERLKREALAKPEDRSFLFLTRAGQPYTGATISRLMTELRRDATKAGLKFTTRFKFHQTRATYGTNLVRVLLTVTNAGDAVEMVRDAMLHKSEATTFRYLRFVERTRSKEAVAEAFSRLFTGVEKRDWNQFVA